MNILLRDMHKLTIIWILSYDKNDDEINPFNK